MNNYSCSLQFRSICKSLFYISRLVSHGTLLPELIPGPPAPSHRVVTPNKFTCINSYQQDPWGVGHHLWKAYNSYGHIISAQITAS